MVRILSSVSVPDQIGVLQHLRPFRGVGGGQLLQALDLGMQPVEVEAGQLLTEEGEVDPALMVVVSGEVDVTLGQPPVRLACAGPGEILGELAVFGRGQRRTASLRARTDCELLVLEGRDLARLRERGNHVVPALEAAALRAVGARLMATRERLTALGVGRSPAEILAGQRAWLASLRAVLAGSEPRAAIRPTLVGALACSGLFDGASGEWFAALEPLFEARWVRQGDVLFQERDPRPGAWLLADAKVSLIRERCPGVIVELEQVGSGELLGLETLIGASARSASAYVIESGWVFKLDAERYAALEGRRGPAAALMRRAVYDGLCRQLEQANARVLEAAQGAS
ncbi:MAG: cyclic nucleotide-binding domain-containing protein [Alphaproteobacteria bacterium]|nr:cyclic nucleotide-binding domain-containing protein [Alphaproteobacteria bacterium]